MHLEWLYRVQYVCRIPKLIGMEQALTQLEVKILFDDSTYYDDDDATEADTMLDAVYEVDADDDLFCIFTFYMLFINCRVQMANDLLCL